MRKMRMRRMKKTKMLRTKTWERTSSSRRLPAAAPPAANGSASRSNPPPGTLIFEGVTAAVREVLVESIRPELAVDKAVAKACKNPAVKALQNLHIPTKGGRSKGIKRPKGTSLYRGPFDGLCVGH